MIRDEGNEQWKKLLLEGNLALLFSAQNYPIFV
jgi:hypothetical protein